MITVDLRQESLTLLELFNRAENDIVRIVTTNGQAFMLVSSEESLEEEAKRLGQSDKFMEFLAERAKKPAKISINELKERVNAMTG